jgi:hypothetical protein
MLFLLHISEVIVSTNGGSVLDTYGGGVTIVIMFNGEV